MTGAAFKFQAIVCNVGTQFKSNKICMFASMSSTHGETDAVQTTLILFWMFSILRWERINPPLSVRRWRFMDKSELF